MTNKLLTICISWQRPELLRKMMLSFYKTKKLADLFIYICDDDIYLEQYKEMLKEFPEAKVEIGKHLFIAEVSNYVPTIEKYEYYQMINDDHLFVGEGWDEDMITELDKYGGWRIAASYMPDELMIGDKNALGPDEPHVDFKPINAPTAEIFSRKIIDVLGFYNVPGYKQYGCDGYIIEIGEDLGGILPFCGKIHHNCWHGLNRMELDKTARETYINTNIRTGDDTYKKWRLMRPIMKEKFKKAKEMDK